MKNNLLKVALAQISPVWLNKQKTLEKIEKSILEMMANPYCDIRMFESLEDKLKKCRTKIEELAAERK